MRPRRLQPLSIFASLLAILLGAGLSACGAVQSTAQLIGADRELEAARAAGAETRSPYEWTAATLYLQKAREEVGHSQYEVAVELARKSAQYAIEARQKAATNPQSESGPSAP